MLDFVQTIVTHPYADLVSALSVIAAIGFLIFFWGFSGYLLAHGDKEHQQNARVQMIQGLSFFIVVFCVWEVIRGGIVLWHGSSLPGLTLTIVVIVVTVFIYRRAKSLLGSPKKGGH